MDDEVDSGLCHSASSRGMWLCGGLVAPHGVRDEVSMQPNPKPDRSKKSAAWFPVPSRQFESHEESRSNAAPLHVSVSPHESGDRYREGSAKVGTYLGSIPRTRRRSTDGYTKVYGVYRAWPAARYRA